MDKLRALINDLREFKEKRDEYVEQAIREHEDEILSLNTEDQLYRKGITYTGRSVSPYYTPRTVDMKKEKGQITSHVTLRDTGDFHKSFYIGYRSGGFIISASDRKTRELEKKYSDEIFGLTKENIDFVAEEYVKEVIEQKLNEIKNGK